MAVELCVYERSGEASALAGWCWQGELVPTPLKNPSSIITAPQCHLLLVLALSSKKQLEVA